MSQCNNSTFQLLRQLPVDRFLPILIKVIDSHYLRVEAEENVILRCYSRAVLLYFCTKGSKVI